MVPDILPMETPDLQILLSHFDWFASSTKMSSKPHQAITDEWYATGEDDIDLLQYIPQPQHLPAHDVLIQTNEGSAPIGNPFGDCGVVDRRGRATVYHCSICGEQGHNRSCCPRAQQQQPQPIKHCSICGEQGHNRGSHCPTCGELGHGQEGCPQLQPPPQQPPQQADITHQMQQMDIGGGVPDPMIESFTPPPTEITATMELSYACGDIPAGISIQTPLPPTFPTGHIIPQFTRELLLQMGVVFPPESVGWFTINGSTVNPSLNEEIGMFTGESPACQIIFNGHVMGGGKSVSEWMDEVYDKHYKGIDNMPPRHLGYLVPVIDTDREEISSVLDDCQEQIEQLANRLGELEEGIGVTVYGKGGEALQTEMNEFRHIREVEALRTQIRDQEHRHKIELLEARLAASTPDREVNELRHKLELLEARLAAATIHPPTAVRKTELCRHWRSPKGCSLTKEACSFAHGVEDMRKAQNVVSGDVGESVAT